MFEISESEIGCGIPITDIAYNLADPFKLAREFTVFYFVAKQITKGTAEILVTRIRQK